MTDIKWIKIVTDIFDDEKMLLIETLPEADSIIVIWFKLLCLAGKQNNSGVFTLNGKIPYTEKMLATIFRRKETIEHEHASSRLQGCSWDSYRPLPPWPWWSRDREMRGQLSESRV